MGAHFREMLRFAPCARHGAEEASTELRLWRLELNGGSGSQAVSSRSRPPRVHYQLTNCNRRQQRTALRCQPGHAKSHQNATFTPTVMLRPINGAAFLMKLVCAYANRSVRLLAFRYTCHGVPVLNWPL